MMDDRFEWDDAKAEANLRKHGIAFEVAKAVFDDPKGLVDYDDSTGEARDLIIGMVAGVVLVVISTDRGSRLRIISARRANRHEQDRYYRQALH